MTASDSSSADSSFCFVEVFFVASRRYSYLTVFAIRSPLEDGDNALRGLLDVVI